MTKTPNETIDHLPKAPRIVIDLTGGVCQAISADMHVEVFICSYDYEDIEDAEASDMISDAVGVPMTRVAMHVEVQPEFVDRIVNERADDGRCRECGVDLDSPSADGAEDGICGSCIADLVAPVIKTWQFDCAREGDLFGEEFTVATREDAEAAALDAINTAWEENYATYAELAQDVAACGLIEHRGEMGPRPTVEEMGKVADLHVAAGALLAAFGGNTPDWLADEANALSEALLAVDAMTKADAS